MQAPGSDKYRINATVSLAVLWIFALAMYALNAFSAVENRLFDALYQRDSQPDTRIVVIGIDDDSISRIGQWPWPRDVMADVVEILAEGGAAAVGIDVQYDMPGSDGQGDARLADAISKAGNVTMPVQGLFRLRTADVSDGYMNADDLVMPLQMFLDSGAMPAHVNSFADSDGMVRRAFLHLKHGDDLYPSFAFSVYETYANHAGEAKHIQDIPVDRADRYYINYTGRSGFYRPVSFADVYDGVVPAGYFADKIVLIGLYTHGVARDWHFTSIDREHATYGIEIHANMVQQFLEGAYIRDAAPAADIALFAAFTVLSSALFLRLKPGFGFLALVLILSAYAGVIYAMVTLRVAVQMVYAPAYCVLAFFTAMIWHYARTRANELRVRGTFGKYMAPDVIEKILADGEEGLKLGGRRMGVTVLFADIRGFTPLSETLEPEAVVQILNEYLDLVATCIRRYGGTLDKFIGDAAMAIWNAPYDVSNHALAAVRAAMDMRSGSGALERKIRERYGCSLRFGIGINSGDAIIGNIGASFRMDYTAIGDTVNTAARLESNAKPGQILVAANVVRLLADSGEADIPLAPLGAIKVKGKSEKIEIFEVINAEV